jgi:ribonuclease Z
MKIQIIFLGTGQAIPTRSRNHSSIFISYKNENLLFDCGEGTQRQFRIAKLNPCKITKIFITHWHGDHILGLPGLLQTLALNNYSKKLELYGPIGTKKYINVLSKIFVPLGKLKLEVSEVKNKKIISNKDFEIVSYSLDHDTPCNGYYFKELDKLRIDKEKFEKLNLPNVAEIANLTKGKDIFIKNMLLKSKELTYKVKGKKVSIILDTKPCKNVKNLARNSDVAIIESTYSDDDKKLALKNKHMTNVQSAKIAKKYNAKELVLTHISQRYEKNEDKILSEAKKIFKNTRLAQDFMKLEI